MVVPWLRQSLPQSRISSKTLYKSSPDQWYAQQFIVLSTLIPCLCTLPTGTLTPVAFFLLHEQLTPSCPLHDHIPSSSQHIQQIQIPSRQVFITPILIGWARLLSFLVISTAIIHQWWLPSALCLFSYNPSSHIPLLILHLLYSMLKIFSLSLYFWGASNSVSGWDTVFPPTGHSSTTGNFTISPV